MAEPGAFLEGFDEGERAILSSLRFAVVAGRFYEDLAQRLLRGAEEGFAMAGVPASSIRHASVPGAYELPFAAKLHAESGEVAGVACPGGVLPVDTDHYDFVRA